MNHMVTGLQFHDPQGLAKYPVDESQLAEARAIVKSYAPTAYFKRRLVIPEIELRDWWIAMPVAKPTKQIEETQKNLGRLSSRP